jgi:hypothetical protein
MLWLLVYAGSKLCGGPGTGSDLEEHGREGPRRGAVGERGGLEDGGVQSADGQHIARRHLLPAAGRMTTSGCASPAASSTPRHVRLRYRSEVVGCCQTAWFDQAENAQVATTAAKSTLGYMAAGWGPVQANKEEAAAAGNTCSRSRPRPIMRYSPETRPSCRSWSGCVGE